MESGLNGKLKDTLLGEPLAVDNATFVMKVKLICVILMDSNIFNGG